MRVFVAGGTGVVGRNLIPVLVTAGHQVTATTRTQARTGQLRALGAAPAVSTYVLPPVLKRFAALHPRVDVAVRPCQ